MVEQHSADAREVRRVRVCFVCSGNICRSPTAEVVFQAMVEAAGLAERVVVDSAGTGDWHIGERADTRALTALRRRGYDGAAHRARQFDPHWFADLDIVIALDSGQERVLRGWAPNSRDREKVRLLRDFDPPASDSTEPLERDVPDPYYGDDAAFERVLDDVERASTGLLDDVRSRLADPSRLGASGPR